MMSEMSNGREELLLATSYAAHAEALKHLSDAGCEVLEMMEYTARNSGLSITEAFVEASATASLSERDKDVIKAYLARRTLIEAFSEEMMSEE